MEITNITEIIIETKNIKTIKFKLPRDPEPGQFIMVWVPGAGEIPMSLSYAGPMKGITVEAVGESTRALHALRPGDIIGVKGPLGRGFSPRGSEILAVGGGTGIAALALAAESIVSSGGNVRAALGARSSDCLLFCNRFAEKGIPVTASTDDGTQGHCGFATDIAAKLIGEKRPDMIIACGPEPMMAAMLRMAREEEIPIQCSLERYMKCGIGLCGSCQCGKYTVCGDGPVFDGETLANIPDFGKWKRDASGRKVNF